VPAHEVDLAADPTSQLREAIKSAHPEGVFLGAVLCAWEGEVEGAMRALLEGTKSSDPQVRNACFTMLKLLTGKSFGRDRKKWIRFFLANEKLMVAGPLTEW